MGEVPARTAVERRHKVFITVQLRKLPNYFTVLFCLPVVKSSCSFKLGAHRLKLFPQCRPRAPSFKTSCRAMDTPRVRRACLHVPLST